mmetsp:Transcript_2963/g.11321  ORF Transcript_2963/g.11321 Transcript_2963/m.11321 type:complete len:266 (+) Transcript_2963:1806-2603(+)
MFAESSKSLLQPQICPILSGCPVPEPCVTAFMTGGSRSSFQIGEVNIVFIQKQATLAESEKKLILHGTCTERWNCYHVQMPCGVWDAEKVAEKRETVNCTLEGEFSQMRLSLSCIHSNTDTRGSVLNIIQVSNDESNQIGRQFAGLSEDCLRKLLAILMNMHLTSNLRHIGENSKVFLANDADREGCFRLRLINAREGTSCVAWLELSAGHVLFTFRVLVFGSVEAHHLIVQHTSEFRKLNLIWSRLKVVFQGEDHLLEELVHLH